MTDYWMVRLGYGGASAEELIGEGYIGVDYDIDFDVSAHLGRGPAQFRRTMNDLWLERTPGGTRIGAGQSMGMLWLACEGIREGDAVITCKADGSYTSGTVVGEYEYHPEETMKHRRRVEWHPGTFTQDEMSPGLRAAMLRKTVFVLSAHATELARLTQSGAAHRRLAALRASPLVSKA